MGRESTNKLTVFLGGAVCYVLWAVPAGAHHSRAGFDLDRLVEYRGVVTRYEWVNPHTFVYVATTTPEGESIELEIETAATPVLRRRGWSPDSLAAGERITVTGFPHNNPERRYLLGNVFTKADGSELRSRGEPSTHSLATDSPAGSSDFSGVWRPLGMSEQGLLVGGFEPTELPVTEKGATALARYDAADDPSLDCLAPGVPRTLFGAYLLEIDRRKDQMTFHYEASNQIRVVYLDESADPGAGQRSHLGHSSGALQGGALVIETGNFSEEVWGNGRGLPSGTQKRVVERYTLLENGTRLRLTYEHEDPEYLAEPIARTHEWAYAPDGVLFDRECDPEVARRHLGD